jgi:predicted nuclease with TOPRIM domain
MGKVEGQLKPKMEKLEKIKDRLKDSRGKKEVPQLQNRLQELQTQLEQSKTSLASIKNASTETIRFISEVPQLTARLNLAKDQHNKLLKDQISDSSLREMATNGEYELL